MKRKCFFLIGTMLLLNTGWLMGQSVGLLTVSQMEDRFSAGGDTAFVVNFWATWCAPCVRELPYFQEVSDKHRSSAVKVLLISLDSRSSLEKKVVPFVGRTGMTAEFFLLDETNQQQYIDRIESSWSGALPATLVVNPGKGKRVFIEGEVTYNQLEEALSDVK